MLNAVGSDRCHLVMMVREWGGGGGSSGESKMFNAVGSEMCHLVLMMRDSRGRSSRERHKMNDIKHRRCTHQKHSIFCYSYLCPPVAVIDDFF